MDKDEDIIEKMKESLEEKEIRLASIASEALRGNKSSCYLGILKYLIEHDCRNPLMCNSFKDPNYKKPYGNQVLCPFYNGEFNSKTCDFVDYQNQDEVLGWTESEDLRDRIKRVSSNVMSAYLKYLDK